MLKCLYCDHDADSYEHVIAASLGGRWKPPIVCEAHNQQRGRDADEELARYWAFAMQALAVPRDDGKVGSSAPVIITRTGKPVVVRQDDSVRVKPEVVHNELGMPTHVVGGDRKAALKVAKQVIAGLGEPATYSSQEELTIEQLTIDVTFRPEIFRGVLKTALHFVAALTKNDERVRELAKHLLPAISGATAAEPFVRILAIPREREYQHRLVAWSVGDDCFVAVQLFSAIVFIVALPGISGISPQQLLQKLDGSRPVLEPCPIPNVGWDDASPEPSAAFMNQYYEHAFSIVAVGCGRNALNHVMRKVQATWLGRGISHEERHAAMRLTANEAIAEYYAATPPGPMKTYVDASRPHVVETVNDVIDALPADPWAAAAN